MFIKRECVVCPYSIHRCKSISKRKSVQINFVRLCFFRKTHTVPYRFKNQNCNK